MKRTKPKQVGGKVTEVAPEAQSRNEVWRQKRRDQVRGILAKLPDSMRARKRALARCRALLPDEDFDGEHLWFQVLQAQQFFNLHEQVSCRDGPASDGRRGQREGGGGSVKASKTKAKAGPTGLKQETPKLPKETQRRLDASFRDIAEDVLANIPPGRWKGDDETVAHWLGERFRVWRSMTFREALSDMFDTMRLMEHHPAFQPEVLALRRIVSGDILLHELPGWRERDLRAAKAVAA